VNKIILNWKKKLEEFQIKNKNIINIKIYPFFDDEIYNLMENIRKSNENIL
jgi:hypothetical protein